MEALLCIPLLERRKRLSVWQGQEGDAWVLNGQDRETHRASSSEGPTWAVSTPAPPPSGLSKMAHKQVGWSCPRENHFAAQCIPAAHISEGATSRQ